ncbi:MAG: fimbrial protein [Dysgonomonas sp.]|nr:fimbrial protein [Dysgonomonas sp.]
MKPKSMKPGIYLMLLSTAILIGFNSCSQDDEPEVKGKNAMLELFIEGTPGYKASGALPPDDDTGDAKITRLTIGVFDSSDKVNVIAEPSLAVGAKATVTCEPGDNNSVIVVANAPAGTYAGVTTKTDFIAKTLSLTQDKSILPMTGTKTGLNLTGGGTLQETVSLTRLVARVQITSLKTKFEGGGQYANGKFVLDKIFMTNVKSKSNTAIISTEPVTSDLVHGWTETSTNPDFLSIIDPKVEITEAGYTTPHYFYTFANKDVVNTTRLIIAGYMKPTGVEPEDENTYVYYPIVINKTQIGTEIEENGNPVTENRDGYIDRNKIYSLTATIKGKGVKDPDEEIIPANLELTISVEKWALTVNQNVEFE